MSEDIDKIKEERSIRRVQIVVLGILSPILIALAFLVGFGII